MYYRPKPIIGRKDGQLIMKKAAIIAAVVLAAAAILCAWHFLGKGVSEPLPGEVTVERSDFVSSTDIIDTYTRYPERFTQKVAQSFEMDAAAADSFFAEPENWLAYEIVLKFTNNSASALTFYSLKVPDNGRDGVYICTQLEDGVGVAAGGSADVSITVLCSNGELSDEQARQLADSMSISVIYGRTPDRLGEDGEPVVGETHLAPIS